MATKHRTAVVSIIAATALVLRDQTEADCEDTRHELQRRLASQPDREEGQQRRDHVAARLDPSRDERHQYGHARAENLTALGEASILIGGGVFVVHEAYDRLSSGGGHELRARWVQLLARWD